MDVISYPASNLSSFLLVKISQAIYIAYTWNSCIMMMMMEQKGTPSDKLMPFFSPQSSNWGFMLIHDCSIHLFANWHLPDQNHEVIDEKFW